MKIFFHHSLLIPTEQGQIIRLVTQINFIIEFSLIDFSKKGVYNIKIINPVTPVWKMNNDKAYSCSRGWKLSTL